MTLPDDFEVRVGDALEELEKLPGGCVQTCVTSPPYWGLRDYGVDGQLGLEPTPEAYVEKLVAIFGEVRRVLKDDGTLWLNLGDSYAGGGGAAWKPEDWDDLHSDENYPSESPMRNAASVGLKPKDMVGIPWRVAFALQEDGWWLRSDIIWRKPNPMPESVTDRPTSSHEHIFLFAKSRRYYYDHEAIAEPCGTDPRENYPARARATDRGGNKAAEARGQVSGNADRANSGGFPPTVSSGNKERKHGEDADRPGSHLGRSVPWEGSRRNKRDVWTVTTKPYPDAHFAVYPPELITPPVQAGTSERGQCVACGAPWGRRLRVEGPDGRSVVLEPGQRTTRTEDGDALMGDNMIDAGNRGSFTAKRGVLKRETAGWTPTCDCDADTEPQIVLDPFCGAGTTGVVCTKLGRRFLGIELNPEYAEMARARIMGTNLTLFSGGAA